MKKTTLAGVMCLVLFGSCVTAWAMQPVSMKVTPHGVDYPLIRNTYYPSPKGDPYELSFGIRKWLNPIQSTDSSEYRATFNDAVNWFDLYSGYGVIGHGEEVFTNWAANYRKLNRGH
ncbi:MAG: hypothetical protein HY912_11270 [Desulfomonile tiedjei]|uniref:Uncharacterized protein n=1 Tax=Desulfomonile tiedjei TaxID=2358 RepID=A0A9D6Z3M6_9BACT|nr:hypothetical protein [Desulfomonile tiedjei]